MQMVRYLGLRRQWLSSVFVLLVGHDLVELSVFRSENEVVLGTANPEFSPVVEEDTAPWVLDGSWP